MDMSITFTLKDLLLALLAVAGIVVLVLLCLLLIRVMKVLKNVNGILDQNTENLNKTMSSLPELTERVNTSLEDVNAITSTAHHVVDDAGELVDRLVTPEGGGNIVSVMVNVAKLVKSLLKK